MQTAPTCQNATPAACNADANASRRRSLAGQRNTVQTATIEVERESLTATMDDEVPPSEPGRFVRIKLPRSNY